MAKAIFKVPVKPFVYLTNLFCKTKAGFSLFQEDTLKKLKASDYPILFIHGEKDTFVPTSMSYANFAVCSSEKKLLTIDGAAHATSYIVNPVMYQEALLQFFAEND